MDLNKIQTLKIKSKILRRNVIKCNKIYSKKCIFNCWAGKYEYEKNHCTYFN